MREVKEIVDSYPEGQIVIRVEPLGGMVESSTGYVPLRLSIRLQKKLVEYGVSLCGPKTWTTSIAGVRIPLGRRPIKKMGVN
jgi:hypothetical protein